MHLKELSWNKVNHPDDVVQPGQQVQCRVLKVDAEKDHIFLSMKVRPISPLQVLLYVLGTVPTI